MLWNAVKGVLGNFKEKVLAFFGIHSPARWGVFVGEMIDKGIINGLVKNAKGILGASNLISDTISNAIQTDDTYEANIKVRQASQYVGSTDLFYKENGIQEIMNKIKKLEGSLEQQKIVAYFYLDKKLIAKTLAEPINDIIENNKKFDTMLMGVRV